ncbi:helix-turn-helix domain-containing protein [Chelatococcus sp. SYSU_G07232]|uniref:Helix-turn-helix domain-containing protein n=1 Tax=Chelatococcus albus TaxID=3047466 RepID=A0ABT7AHN6_9HYPH|nr:helix-turn-helix domain-containing protein [Chelatococcus sp. SYSU_G07232]MDJ1158897.1 helix-turn-helix domain-containing protein [Chelatococcus sp. SYSU_G07232]
MESAALADNLDIRLGRRLKAMRTAAGLTLDELAGRAGISRAMISRIERGESSPTAALLGRLCAGLGISLAAVFADDRRSGDPLSRAAAQPVWRDPASGYLRRDVTPPGTGSPVEIVDVTFPPGADVRFDNPWTMRTIDQHVWVLDGELELTVGAAAHRLATGDCLHMRLDGPIRFRNTSGRPVRYAVVLTMTDRCLP